MIWVAGRIVPDDALTVSVRDRTFEHGLGLFETFRTWNGHPTLLNRHLTRLQNSARELRLPLDPSALPDAAAVAALHQAEGIEGDARFRITLTGGWNENEGSVLWMRCSPLPPPARAGAILKDYWEVTYDDPLAKHKSLNYWRRRRAFELAQAQGEQESRRERESISRTPDYRIWEGSRTNLFVIGSVLNTPPTEGPILPGIMRAVVIERARAIGVKVNEMGLTKALIDVSREVFLTNSVRGIIPVQRAWKHRFDCPGAITRRLWDDLSAWLNNGGEAP